MSFSCCDVVVQASWWMRLMNTAEGARARVSRWKAVTQADGHTACRQGEEDAGARRISSDALHALWKTCCARKGDGGRQADGVGAGSAMGWTLRGAAKASAVLTARVT
jgi:hypothetical protein